MPPETSQAKVRSGAARTKPALLWTSTAYFGEGLPWSFLHQMATEFLTAINASKTQIGSTSLLHLAVTFKFLWSPIVDLFGRMRTWVWRMQLLLGLGMLGVALLTTTGSLSLFWTALAVLAVMHATHDIACDGFYLQALDKHDQALYAGTRNAAYRLALLVGSSLLVALAGATTWVIGFAAAGAVMIGTALVNRAILPIGREPWEESSNLPRSLGGGEPLSSERHPQTSGGAGVVDPAHFRRWAFLAAYRSFFQQPQAGLVLSFMFLFRLGDIMMFAMSKPLFRDLGIDTAHRGILNGVSMAASIAGSIVGGAIVARRGLERTLTPITYLQNLAIPLYVGLAVLKPHFLGVVPVVFAEQFAGGMGIAAYSVFQMHRCRKAFSASHFALATATVSVASTISGWISGPLNERLGNPRFFAVAFAASIPGLILVLFVPKRPIDSTDPLPDAAAS